MGTRRLKFLLFPILGFLLVLLFLIFRKKKEEEVFPFENGWEEAIPFQLVPEGLSSLSAEQCGVCHTAHYEEWKTSSHAWAWKDEQFQAELNKESSPYLCINCHIPLQNQQEWIVDGLIGGDIYRPAQRKNGRFDRKLQQEGISCAVCHVRNNMVIGTSGSDRAPHATVKDPKFLSESLCINCHNAVAVVTSELVCSFETGDEWKSGPYFKEKNCISCHMEKTSRSLVSGYEVRTSHYHSFPGSGISKHDTQSVKMLQSLQFELLPMAESGNGKKEFELKVRNEYAGHRVPTGDPERFILIQFYLYDGNGFKLEEKTERIGETWKWYPKARKIEDNNLDPKEERTFWFKPHILKPGVYRLLVVATKYRTSRKTADYNKLSASYPISAEMYREEHKFVVKK